MYSDQFRHFQLPLHTGHDIHRISTADSDCHHSQTSGIRSMGISTHHHTSGESIILQHYLMNDTRTRLPESNAKARRHIPQKVIYLAVTFCCCRNIRTGTFICLDQVVTMHGRRDSHSLLTGIDKLQQRHLCRRILHSHTVGSEIHIILTTFVFLQQCIIIQMRVQNLFCQRQRTLQHCSYPPYLLFKRSIKGF